MKYHEIINSDTPVLVDFFTDWYGPCKLLSPILTEVKNEIGDIVKFVKVDVYKDQSLATKLEVCSVPSMILFKNGKQVWKRCGALQKNEIIALINEHTNNETESDYRPDFT